MARRHEGTQWERRAEAVRKALESAPAIRNWVLTNGAEIIRAINYLCAKAQNDENLQTILPESRSRLAQVMLAGCTLILEHGFPTTQDEAMRLFTGTRGALIDAFKEAGSASQTSVGDAESVLGIILEMPVRYEAEGAHLGMTESTVGEQLREVFDAIESRSIHMNEMLEHLDRVERRLSKPNVFLRHTGDGLHKGVRLFIGYNGSHLKRHVLSMSAHHGASSLGTVLKQLPFALGTKRMFSRSGAKVTVIELDWTEFMKRYTDSNYESTEQEAD